MNSNHTEDKHKYCGLADFTNERLAQACAEAVDRQDWGKAYHIAEHHMRRCHLPISDEQVAFMTDQLPTLSFCARDIIVAEFGKVPRMPAESDTPFPIQMAARQVENQGSNKYKDAALRSWFSAAHLSTYVATRGKGCLFSLIDPKLCQEEL